ncbi:MAG: diadenosine tetraphosphate (Ap4A) HIT family hydrolase [Planctomycetota bacterium]|jgi:diadenosine tetraphosphate (Ap4A) HIT family hydrolase
MSTPTGAISNRLARILRGEDPELLLRMPSGYAVLGKYQPDAVRGCCMLLPDPVVASPNELSHAQREQFFSDLVLLGDAVLEATGAERINYLVLCNQVPELHGHAIPRFAEEDPELRMQGPFEAYDFGSAPVADAGGAEAELHAKLRTALEGLLEYRAAHDSSG